MKKSILTTCPNFGGHHTALGMNIKVLSGSMGHTNIRQTEEYITVQNQTLVNETKKIEGVLHLKVA